MTKAIGEAPVDTLDAGIGVVENDEEYEGEHQDDLRQHIDAEPNDEQRSERDAGDSVDRYEEGIKDVRYELRPAEDDAGQKAQHRSERKSRDHRAEGER
jgi:hypothetical protein